MGALEGVKTSQATPAPAPASAPAKEEADFAPPSSQRPVSGGGGAPQRTARLTTPERPPVSPEALAQMNKADIAQKRASYFFAADKFSSAEKSQKKADTLRVKDVRAAASEGARDATGVVDAEAAAQTFQAQITGKVLTAAAGIVGKEQALQFMKEAKSPELPRSARKILQKRLKAEIKLDKITYKIWMKAAKKQQIAKPLKAQVKSMRPPGYMDRMKAKFQSFYASARSSVSSFKSKVTEKFSRKQPATA